MKTVSTYLLRTKIGLTAAMLFALSVTGIAQTNYYVSPSGNNANNGLSAATPKPTIAAAFALAVDGDIVNLANGTYSLTTTLNFNKSVSVIGQSEAGVIIDGHTIAGGWILNPNRSNISLSNFTVKPNGTNGGFPIHVGANSGNPLPVLTNINLTHITINSAKKTAFDFNAVNNLSISYLTATNTSNGNGVQFSGCWNVTADHITTSGNAWGGLAVYVSNPYPNGVGRGSNNITIDATTSSFAEPNGVYNQNENGFTNTNLAVTGYDYAVQNASVVGYTYYFASKALAMAFTAVMPNPTLSAVKQLSSNQWVVNAPLKIQAAINVANPGDKILVYPGTYIETAPGSTLFDGGTYTFGLFIPASKPGLSLMGVDAGGIPVSNASAVLANVQTNATNGFGPSGVFVEGDNVTVSGLNIYLDPNGDQNKTVEVIGENFTMKNCRLSDGNSLYINDWRYNVSTDISHITKYLIDGNRFESGTSLDIANAAGKSGPNSGRIITNNYFDANGGNWAMVSFNGSGTGVPWFTYAVGGAVITGNSFVKGEQYIRHRGTVDNSQFNWADYWNTNSFDKAVITLSDETNFTPRVYSYAGSYGTFNNVKRIGAIIQSDITDVAQAGDLVKIGAGTYTENIVVNKGVELRGKGQSFTKIIPAISNPDCGGGGGGSICVGGSNVILVQANNVTIGQLTIDGDNPTLSGGASIGGANVDARNGIITDHTLNTPFNNLKVDHVTVQNIFLRGIYASSGGTFSFSNNTVTNVQGNGSSIALFNFGGSGSFTNNTVSNAADAIASNWSKGSVYTGNTITNSGSGIHTDNNGGSGGAADMISNNLVANSSANGYGIWVFAPYLPVTVKDNTISNVDVGLTVAGQQSPVLTTFTGNTVDAQHKVNSTGVYTTTSLFGFGSADVNAVFTNNDIRNNADGFYLESEAGYKLNLTANNNNISGNSNSNVTQATGVGGAGIFAADMNCNWWGTPLGTAINASINGAGVAHNSWLADGTDADASAPGFQSAAICAGPVSNAQISSITNVSCYGSSNGSVTISFVNGIGSVSYSLDGGNAVSVAGASFNINGLAAGSHAVVITDAAGNTAVTNFTITQPAAVLSANFTFTPILCNGGLSTQNVVFTGGTAPYSMTNQGGGVFINGASEGVTYGGNTGNTFAANYVYTVTDAKGCTYTFNANITQPSPITVNYSASPILCNGGLSTESITINGGTAPYTVTNQGGGALVIGASSGVTYHGNTYAATYNYTVTDANGCQYNFTTNITQPSPLIVNSTATTITCNGNAAVTVTASGGKAPYTGTGVFMVAGGTYTYTVTDANGCSATTTITPAVIADTQKPTVTVMGNWSVPNDPGKCGADIVVAPPATADNCGVASVISNHPSTYFPVGTTIIKWIVTDNSGNVNDTSTQTITVIDNEKPVIQAVAAQTFCTTAGGIYTIPVLNATDNCSVSVSYVISGATSRTGNTNNASGSFNAGVSTITWSATDPAGHVVKSTTTVTISAAAPATITVSNADAFCNKLTLTASAGTSYQWMSGSSPIGNNQQLSLGQSNGDGVYSVTVTVNGCTSAPASYTFNKQVLASSYTILATKEIELGENNIVASGSVGVTSANGEAQFSRNSSVSSSGSFVKAKKITKNGSGIVITNPIYTAATGIALPTMYLNTANTNNLPNKDVAANSTTTVSGNYKNLTLKKGSNTTLTGNTFGSIRVEQGARVSFTATTINIDKLQVVKGPRTGYSYVRFAPDTKVLVSGSVSIGSQVFINPDNNKVTFYMGDKKPDDEKFTVKGGDTKVNANIYMPNGKLKVTGGYRYGDYGYGRGDCDDDDDDDRYFGQGTSYVYMTGLFITEEIEGNGKNVVWNSFDCSAGPVSLINYTPAATVSTATEEKSATSEEELKVTVMPNPSTTYFTLKLESKYATPVSLRVMDGRGRVIDARSKLGSNSTLQIGQAYSSGTYFAELIQGTRRKVVQLVKVVN
jgi:SepF-like predicted cell division protein (DUF552 family)